MTIREISKQVHDLERLAKKVKSNPKEAIRLLHETGMYTEKGNLKKLFQ